MIYLVILLVVLACVVGFLYESLYIVTAQNVAIVERLGKFQKVAHEGLNFKIPLIDRVRSKLTLKVQQLNVENETKTKDNVFVSVPIAVQYNIVPGREKEAYYSLTNPEEQIFAYVQDTVRTILAKMDLDESFESKDDIGRGVEEMLSEKMSSYGFKINNSLVIDIRPAESVRTAMNEINSAQRKREAAIQLAEADKIKIITAAQGEAEAKRLQGVGIANERKAITDGIASQVETLRKAGITVDPTSILMLTQHYDTMNSVARNAKSSILFMPSNPSSMGEIANEIRTSLLAVEKLNKEE